jgi:type I restriction enzyme S subunit
VISQVKLAWPRRRVEELVTIRHGFAFLGVHFREFGVGAITTPGNFEEEGGFRHVGAKQRYYTGPYPADYRLDPGNLIVAMTEQAEGLLGSAALVPDNGVWLHNQRIGRVTAKSNELNLSYLFHIMNHSDFRRAVNRRAPGSKVRHTSPTKLGAVEIPVPSLREQVRIAGMLSAAEDLVAALERLYAKKQAIKQGIMQQLLTGKTRLPGFTESWTERRLGDHVTYLRTVALSRAQLDDGSPLRYLHYGDIHGSSRVALDAATTGMPRAMASLVGSAARLQVGDLVFADASEDPAGVGKSVEISSVPVDGVVPGLHTVAARFDKDYLADGFKAYLQFHPTFRTGLLRLVAGTKVLATTRSYISSITLALPGVAEQQAIAGVLQDAGAEIELLGARLFKARSIKQGMMQELLTGRTRLPAEGSTA